MKTRWKVLAFALLLLGGGLFGYCLWKSSQPRRNAIQTLNVLSDALLTKNAAIIFKTIVLPRAIIGDTRNEQENFLSKALQSEISQTGIEALNRHAAFGSLSNLFPTDGARWAEQAGVKPEDCVAFRMEHNGVRAEVVLVREGQSYRIVRCNNVKQMARKG